MAGQLPERAQAVIIGGGVVGCSVAYHLAKAGWTDVVLLERKRLSSGTTWHAAGLVGQLRATHNLTRLAQYTCELFAGLEAETGQATGFRRRGSLALAATKERFEEWKRAASMASCFGLEVEVITPSEARELYPIINIDDLQGAVYLPGDGQVNPADVTQAFAKGARNHGARIFENTRVIGVETKAGRVRSVRTAEGEIATDYVVNCAGMWARQLGRMSGVNIPLHAAEHFYIVTEPIEGLPRDLPVMRDQDNCAYFKEDAGKLLIGAFEPVAKPWGMDGIPEDFEFGQLPEDIDHFEPVLERALERVPLLRDAGIQTFFNGPESFTPDNRYYLGEAPEVRNYFVAAGFNSIGIQSSGGAGKVIAEWMDEGHPPMDLWDVDIRRALPFQGNRRYLAERTAEVLGLLYAMHWPFRQVESARPVRLSALHERLAAQGACFGEMQGWERANWFAPAGVEPRYEYSYGRQNWFACSGQEHRAVREGVGVFDQSSFAKYLLQGRDAEQVLNRVCANDVAVEPGRIVYTQWLNERGGIEADLTVTRTGEDEYFIVTAPATQVRDFDWLRRHIPADAHAFLTDVTSAYAVLGLMGPLSRELLSSLTPEDLSNDAFPFMSSRRIEIGRALARASRITYVGELGWELYIPSEFAVPVYDAIVAAGVRLGLRHCGYHALNSLRIEKGYRHWGHDISDEDTPLEAGLGFALAWDKPGGFIGREALLEQKKSRLTRRLAQFVLDDPGPLMIHDEPIWRDGVRVGRTTSAMFGHTLGAGVALGYVESESGATREFIEGGKYEIEIARERYPARVSLRPLYDPEGKRVRM
ncbi:MAG: FAD-dependent oxidoreductase [Arenicellales bacterium]